MIQLYKKTYLQEEQALFLIQIVHLCGVGSAGMSRILSLRRSCVLSQIGLIIVVVLPDGKDTGDPSIRR